MGFYYKIVCLFVASLLPITVSAADFRGMTFGDDCQSISANERSLGSKTEAEEGVFLGEYLGMPASITYACQAERLVRGTYTFWFNEYTDAKQFYKQHKLSLIERYGKPAIDQGSSGYLDYMASIGFEIKDEHRYVLLWQLPQRSITYGANREYEGEPRAWVSIDIVLTE